MSCFSFIGVHFLFKKDIFHGKCVFDSLNEFSCNKFIIAVNMAKVAEMASNHQQSQISQADASISHFLLISIFSFLISFNKTERVRFPVNLQTSTVCGSS